MAKKCIIQRNENGTIDVDVKNYDNITALERAVKLNKGYPMDTASNGEPSLLYQFYINELNMSPTEAEYVMTNMFSPEFGEWFGRWWEEGNEDVSHVRDDNGQPKPVWSGHPKRLKYHYAYTNRELENRADNDAFFPENKRLAQTYSNGGALDFRTLPASLAEKMSTGSVEPVFLNIRNEKEVVRNNGMVMAELLETGQAEGNDGFSGGSHAHPDEKVWSILDDSQVLYINGAEENDIVDEELPSEIVETGTKLAPNDNPSNLTDAQWEMVRTPEFIQFFGDWLNDPQNASQIVDENGEPMVVYHGTNKDFNVFEGVSIEGRNLSFFTPDIEYATAYSLIQRKTRGTPVVMGVFLNIRDPKESKEINTLEIVKDIKQDPSATNDGYRGVDKVTGRQVIVSTQPGQIKSIENIGRFSESENIYFQNESQNNSEPIPQEVLQEITDVLTQKGLVSQVNLMTPQELRQVLEEMGLSEETMKQIEVWHGSPHLFDKFSTSVIGTGEGNQVFGWGLYFTDLKSIAENYAEKLSKKTIPAKVYINGEVARNISLKGLGSEFASIEEIYDAYKGFSNFVEKSKTDSRYEFVNEKTYRKFVDATILHTGKLIEDIESIKNGTKEGTIEETPSYEENTPRNLYNVSLHEGKTPEQYTWLEWDIIVPLNIKNKIKEQAKKENFPERIMKVLNGEVVEDINGAQLYEVLQSNYNKIPDNNQEYLGQKEASLFLLRAGIDGVKYPAESLSRGATSDTARGFNYVVFDENAVTINEVVQFQNDLEKAGLKLTPNGFYRPSNRQIYLNSENPNILETTIHEFAHPFLQYLRDNKPAHYRAGVKLLQSNQEEAQSYIDFVKQTQPALKEGTQAFYEEVLAQIVGDNGAKLVNSTKKNSIQEWLENLWATIGRLVGITKYTPDEISRMTLEEFSNSVVAEMMDRQGILNSEITLSVLEQPLFTGMRGRSVSPQTISNAVKGKGIKQIERDIITSVLKLPEFQTKKINYDNFELAVKAQLIPLEKIETSSYAEYGSSEIGNFDSQKTIIYNSPLSHGVTGHFTQDYGGKKKYKTSNTRLYPIGNVYTLLYNPKFEYKDEVESMESYLPSSEIIKKFPNIDFPEDIDVDSELEQLNLKGKGLFGHTRVWVKDDVYNVAEVQSDVFQKEDIESILNENNPLFKQKLQELGDLNEESDKHMIDFHHAGYSTTSYPDNIKTIHRKKNIFGQELGKSEGVSIEKRDNEDSYFISFEGNHINGTYYASRPMAEERLKSLAEEEKYERNENIVKDISELPENLKEGYIFLTQLYKQKVDEIEGREILNSQEKQFLASEKSFELRLIRESIQDAANKGFKKLRLPLPYTLSKIEGYLNEDGQVQIEGEPEIGEYVDYLGGSYRVVDYEGDDVKIISEGQLNDSDKDQYIKDWAYNEIESILYDHFQDENTHSLDEIKSKLDQTELKVRTKYNIVQMLKEESEQTDEIDITNYRDEMEEIFADNISNWDLEEYLSDLNYSTVVFTKDRVLYSTEEGEWVSYADGSQDKESFSIDDLSEYHQPIARRYEAFGEMMKKERPSNFRIVEDENGYPWYETDILDQDKRNPILAFQKPINISQRDFIPSQLFEELSQQPFLNQEQALDIYQSIYTDDLNHWKDADLNC